MVELFWCGYCDEDCVKCRNASSICVLILNVYEVMVYFNEFNKVIDKQD